MNYNVALLRFYLRVKPFFLPRFQSIAPTCTSLSRDERSSKVSFPLVALLTIYIAKIDVSQE